jgi:hypothetical protein
MRADYQSSAVGRLIEDAGLIAAENGVISTVEATGQILAAWYMSKAPLWRKTMKAALAVLLLVLCASAAAQTADAIYRQACGPLNAKFVVEQAKGQPPAAPEPGKALVYFIQKESGPYFTTRLGLDGAWVGVIQHASYIFVSVAPGAHHACAATLNRKRPEAEFVHFTVEAGKTYYFLVRGTAANSAEGGGFAAMVFGAADRDEALFLIASYPQSVAKPAR